MLNERIKAAYYFDSYHECIHAPSSLTPRLSYQLVHWCIRAVTSIFVDLKYFMYFEFSLTLGLKYHSQII